nr:MAG TPA: hypothetical protein [Caudoviricetes sp.]
MFCLAASCYHIYIILSTGHLRAFCHQSRSGFSLLYFSLCRLLVTR